MPNDYRILPSALKHGVTEKELAFVLSDRNPTSRFYEIHEDEYGNPQDMVVGYAPTRPGPIEVGLRYAPAETIVFHAAKVSWTFRKLYRSEP